MPPSCSAVSAAKGRSAIATAAPEPVLVHQLGAHRSPRRAALLLDQEALRLGLEDVAGYNPVHLKRYDRLMRASNGGRAVDRHFELALRYATPQLRSLAVRYYVSPPGRAPPGLPVVYRDRLSVVTRDDSALPFARIVRPGAAAAGRARDLARARSHRHRPARARRLVVADLVYPGWSVTIDGRPAHARSRRRPARGRRAARRAARDLDLHAARRARGLGGLGALPRHAHRSRARPLAEPLHAAGPCSSAGLPGGVVPRSRGFRSCRNLPMHAPWPIPSLPSWTIMRSIPTPPPRPSPG